MYVLRGVGIRWGKGNDNAARTLLGLELLDGGWLSTLSLGDEFSSGQRCLVQVIKHIERHLPIDAGWPLV